MLKIENMQELVKEAIALNHPMMVHWEQYNTKETLNPMSKDQLAPLEKGYDCNNGIVSFVFEGIQYVIPSMGGSVEDILTQERFERKSMYVPFSNWNYPVEFKTHWEQLLNTSSEVV